MKRALLPALCLAVLTGCGGGGGGSSASPFAGTYAGIFNAERFGDTGTYDPPPTGVAEATVDRTGRLVLTVGENFTLRAQVFKDGSLSEASYSYPSPQPGVFFSLRATGSAVRQDGVFLICFNAFIDETGLNFLRYQVEANSA